jgi:glycosyltransferase involved in cell wall biosynthesis
MNANLERFAGRLRILMVGPYPRHHGRFVGGVAAAMTYLSEALATEPGVELLGVRIGGGSDGTSDASGFAWPVRNLPLGKYSLISLYRRHLEAFRGIVNDFQPDIVHAQGTDVAGYLAVRCGRPVVVTVHGLLAECARYQTNPVAKVRATVTALLTERNTVRRAPYLIAISPYVARYYRSEIKGSVFDIPNAVSPAYFNLERTPEPGRLLYAGRIANGKGLPNLLRVASLNRLAVRHIVLAGANHEARSGNYLRNLVVKLGLADVVEFAGLLDERALMREYSCASALVLPSFQETAPMVVQQAMAAGVPVVATSVGGISEQIQDDVTGLLFEPGDEGRLSLLLARLGNERELGEKLSRAARKTADLHYRATSVARSTLAAYRSIAAGIRA